MKYAIAKYPFSMAESIELLGNGFYENYDEACHELQKQANQHFDDEKWERPPIFVRISNEWYRYGWKDEGSDVWDEHVDFILTGVPTAMPADLFVAMFGPGR